MSNVEPRKENICAVIVTFHPDKREEERIINILKQVEEIVIVDNKSSDEEIGMLREISKGNTKCHLIANEKNLGIATALNQGVRWAKDKGFKWALLMDQDSNVKDYMIETQREVYNAYVNKDKISIIGSNFINPSFFHDSGLTENTENKLWIPKKTVITSGSLLSIDVFKIVGDFRDEFFIDHVDDDYCLRSWSRGFDIILACKPTMIHNIGNMTVHNLLGRSLCTLNHSPLRRYYMTRNHVVLIKEYLFRDFKWVKETIGIRLKIIIILCLFEDNKIKKLRAVLKGFIHGLFNIGIKKQAG